MKRKITVLIPIFIFMFLFVGCTSDNKKAETKVTSTITIGDYFLFQTDNADEYLIFLQKFDENQYEIVNIDSFIRETEKDYNNDYFMVTYKKINN